MSLPDHNYLYGTQQFCPPDSKRHSSDSGSLRMSNWNEDLREENQLEDDWLTSQQDLQNVQHESRVKITSSKPRVDRFELKYQFKSTNMRKKKIVTIGGTASRCGRTRSQFVGPQRPDLSNSSSIFDLAGGSDGPEIASKAQYVRYVHPSYRQHKKLDPESRVKTHASGSTNGLVLSKSSAGSVQYNTALALPPKQSDVSDAGNVLPFRGEIGLRKETLNVLTAKHGREGTLRSAEASLTKDRFMNGDVVLTQYDRYPIWPACIVKAKSGPYRGLSRAVLLTENGELAEAYHCQFPDDNCCAWIRTELLALYHPKLVSIVKVSLTENAFGAAQHKAFQIADDLFKERKLSITLLPYTKHLRSRTISGVKAESKNDQYLELKPSLVDKRAVRQQLCQFFLMADFGKKLQEKRIENFNYFKMLKDARCIPLLLREALGPAREWPRTGLYMIEQPSI